MDLSDEVKELLKTVNSSYTKLNEANEEMVKTIESKERANAESFEDRKRLKQELQEAKDNANKTDDKTIQEKLDALNAQWNEKYQAKENELVTIKTDMINKTKLDEFNSLNIAKSFPSDWDDAKVAVAMEAIKGQVLANTIYDEQSKSWVYRNGDVTELNRETGKPMTIGDRFNQVKASGAIDMFLADTSNSGGGSNPKATTQHNHTSKPSTHAEKARFIEQHGSEAYLQMIKSK